VGGFLPRAQSNLFVDDEELYGVDKSDWRGLTGGVELSLSLGERFELGFHVDGYRRELDTSYLGFVRENPRPGLTREIQQTLRLSLVPVGATVRFVPIPERGRLTPYVGAGADLVVYRYEEYGDFIDFESPTLPIVADSFLSEGTSVGAHVVAGLRVPLGYDFSLAGEARYTWAEGDMARDFRGNRLDMGGLSATVGFRLRF
jgi:hypothetical protein